MQTFSISGVSKTSAEHEAAIENLPNLTSGFELAENNIQLNGVRHMNGMRSKMVKQLFFQAMRLAQVQEIVL